MPRRSQIEVLLLLAQLERIDVDGREDHMRVAVIHLVDPSRDEIRVRDEMIHRIRRANVPVAHVVQHHARKQRLDAGSQVRLLQVLMLQVPCIADRRMHVADMDLVGARQDALCHGVATRNDQVVAGHVELFDRERHQRQIRAVALFRLRQFLDERGRDVLAAHPRPLVHEIDDAEKIGFGKADDDLFEHLLRARISDEPVVHDRDAGTRFATRARCRCGASCTPERRLLNRSRQRLPGR